MCLYGDEEGMSMHSRTDRIFTTHVGSLPRHEPLLQYDANCSGFVRPSHTVFLRNLCTTSV